MKRTCLCLTLSIFITLIAACNGQPTTQEAPQGENTTNDLSEENATNQENDTDSAAYQVPRFPAFSPAPRHVELIEDRGDTLLVRHNMGETEVPKNPQRVYVNTNIEVPVALGFDVVGGWYGSWQPVPPAFEEATQDAEIVDWSEVPNYEFVASLEPDLIFHWDNSGDPEVYELLSEIAPTIRFEADPFVYWREATLDLATVFGMEETAKTLLTEYDTTVVAQCERIRSVIDDDTIDLVTVYEDSFHLVGPVWEQAEGFYTPSAYSIWAYRDCQLLPGAEVEELVGVQGSMQLSLEAIAELESEHLFVMQSIGQNETLEDILDEPLWQTLPAVQNGNVYLIEQIGAMGYYSGIYTLELAADAISGVNRE
ncbi:MAG: ABC transporter substrate-binding protein [Chloroflexota bacterium]